MHPLKKYHKKLTVEGGGGVNPYGQPDHKIPRFFLRLAFEAVTFVCVDNKKRLLKYFDMVVV